MVDKISEFAKKKDATPAQIALAWVLAQKPWIAPIPGTTKIHRLEENLKSEQLILSPSELNEIESAFSQIDVQFRQVGDLIPRTRGCLHYDYHPINRLQIYKYL